MTLRLDAQLSPHPAPWIEATFGVETRSVKQLGLRDVRAREIFDAVREAGAVVTTKDQDFAALQARLGSPPQIVWVTCGNTSNANMRRILREVPPEALRLPEAREALVEISNARLQVRIAGRGLQLGGGLAGHLIAPSVSPRTM